MGELSHFLSPWELLVTSEVERKMTLMGHQTSNVIYYQLQGHLTIILMYCSASLFLKERMFRSFGMNTSVYKHLRQIVHSFGYRFNR